MYEHKKKKKKHNVEEKTVLEPNSDFVLFFTTK